MVTRFGLTWWGQRWIGALEALGAAYANRLPRGRTYARRGSVTDLAVAAGKVTARVAGSRPRPYRVSLTLPVFSDADWSRVTTALAGQVRHSAALLDGRMPEDVDEVLGGVGLSLFPHPGELRTSCSCPDAANPCKHVAAVHYVLAQTFDADPFLLPQLRGRDRATLLAALRTARTGVAEGSGMSGVADDDEHFGGVAISTLPAQALCTARGDLAAIPVHPQEVPDPTAVLRRLGPPPGLDASAVSAAVRSAAERAWQLATASDDDPLLAALRDRGSATSRELGDALGRPVPDVRAELRALAEAGLVQRTGHARATRYHA